MLSILGCDDDEKSTYETGQKVVSLIKPDDKNVIEVVVDPSKKSVVSLQAQIDQLSAFGIVVEVEARAELIEKYNKEHGTGYQELSPSSYTFEKSEFIFPKYSTVSSHVQVSLNTNSMQDDVMYLLPVQMILISGDENASIDESGDVLYIKVSKLPPPALVHLKDLEITTEIGIDKKNWFSAYATNSQGGHTFTLEEAAQHSGKMDFVLLKHGSNVRIYPSIIGWKHGGDYQKYIVPYIVGFEKLTHTGNANRLLTIDLFNSVNSAEDMIKEVDAIKASGYNPYAVDRMASHNLQSQITGDSRVLLLCWGPKLNVNTQFGLIYIKDVTTVNGGVSYTMKFDFKYVDSDIREEVLKIDGQNTIIDNPDYN